LKRFLFCLLLAVSAHASDVVSIDTGATLVDRFMNGLVTMQASFTQTIRDGRDQVVEQSGGTLAIKKPGKFHWEYQKPNAQTIVSDGVKLWLYDPELEQVTIRRADMSVNGTPAALLAGQANWRDSFEVTHVEQHDGMTVINLDPKQNDSDFRKLQLALKGDQLVAMSLSDKLGQSTLLDFRQFKRNARLDETQFHFVVPKGADVIDNTVPHTEASNAK